MLKPFRHILKLIQQGDGPSLFMVLPCTLTIRKALSLFGELLKYQMSKAADNKEQNIENIGVEEAELLAESEGKLKHFSFTLHYIINFSLCDRYSSTSNTFIRII